jgi:hypothetical protein
MECNQTSQSPCNQPIRFTMLKLKQGEESNRGHSEWWFDRRSITIRSWYQTAYVRH